MDLNGINLERWCSGATGRRTTDGGTGVNSRLHEFVRGRSCEEVKAAMGEWGKFSKAGSWQIRKVLCEFVGRMADELSRASGRRKESSDRCR